MCPAVTYALPDSREEMSDVVGSWWGDVGSRSNSPVGQLSLRSLAQGLLATGHPPC